MCAIGRALMARPKLLHARRAVDGPRADLRRADLRDRRRDQQARARRSCSSSRTRSWRSTSPIAATSCETGRIVLEGPAERAQDERAGPQDLPRRGLRLARLPTRTRRRTAARAGRRPRRASARDSVRHLERARDRVARDEAERARGDRVAAARDDDAAERERARAAAGPVGVREQRVARAARLGRRRAPRRRLLPRARPAASSSASSALAKRVEDRGGTASCVPCANERVSGWTRISVPPSRTGNASRHRRSASPSAIAADVMGLSGSRGTCGPIHGTPTTSASSGSSSRAPRSSTPRRSASACATDGGPGERGGRRERAPWLARMSRRSDRREEREAAAGAESARRGSSDAGIVRVAAEAAREAREVEHERDADQRDCRARAPPRRRARAPTPARPPPRGASPPAAARGPSPRRTRARSAPGPPWRTVSAATTTTTRSVSTSARWMRARVVRDGPGRARVGRVVDERRARGTSRASGGGSRRSRSRCPSRRARPPATRIVWRSSGHAAALELVDRGRERLLPRVDAARREAGAHGGSTTIVHATAARCQLARAAARRAESAARRARRRRRRRLRGGGGGGRRTTSSSPIGTRTMREPERSGTRRTA